MWNEIKGTDWRNWIGFKKQVEALFGLSDEQSDDVFHAMTRAEWESPYRFILRVESKLKKYGFSAHTCYRSLQSEIPQEVMQRLEDMKEHSKVTG